MPTALAKSLRTLSAAILSFAPFSIIATILLLTNMDSDTTSMLQMLQLFLSLVVAVLTAITGIKLYKAYYKYWYTPLRSGLVNFGLTLGILVSLISLFNLAIIVVLILIFTVSIPNAKRARANAVRNQRLVNYEQNSTLISYSNAYNNPIPESNTPIKNTATPTAANQSTTPLPFTPPVDTQSTPTAATVLIFSIILVLISARIIIPSIQALHNPDPTIAGASAFAMFFTIPIILIFSITLLIIAINHLRKPRQHAQSITTAANIFYTISIFLSLLPIIVSILYVIILIIRMFQK